MKRFLMAVAAVLMAQVASAQQCTGNITVEEGPEASGGVVVVRFERLGNNGLDLGCGAQPQGTSWAAYYCKGIRCTEVPIKRSDSATNRAWIKTTVAGYYHIWAYNRYSFESAFVRIKRR